MKNLSLLFTLFFISIVSFSQDSICDIGAGCSDSPLVFPNTFDNGNAEVGPDYDCLLTQPNPSWYFLGFDENGDVDIEISQKDTSGLPIDVDFICWGPFDDPFIACNNSSILNNSNRISCSYSESAEETLNINNAQIGQFYILLITNFDNNEGNITMTQTNQADVLAGSTDCSYACSVNLEGDKTLCFDTDLTLHSTLGNDSMSASATYKWFKNNIEIIGADTDTYDIIGSSTNTTDIYKVEVEANLCDDVAIDEVEVKYVNVITNLKLQNISDIYICDDDNDGFALFNLNDNNDEIANIEMASNYDFLYYTDTGMTESISNPSNYANSDPYFETIYVSIKHKTAIGCEAVSQFDIYVYDTPKATQLNDWVYCDDDNDGYYNFDLDSLELEILNGQDISKFDISFHHNKDDADDNLNSILSPYINDTAFTSEEIYIRIENKTHTECFDVSMFNISVVWLPVSTQIDNWGQCDDDNDGFYEFDLSILNTDLLNGQDPDRINLSFYNSLVDAEEKILPLGNIYTNKYSFEEEEIFARLENVDKEDCFVTTSFFIKVLENPIFDIVEDTKYICTNLTNQATTFELENIKDNYSFSWQNSNGVELSYTAILSATEIGDYTITATTLDVNECKTTKTVHLLPAYPAEIIDFKINEYWEQDNFSVNIVVNGLGVYQYAIDDVNGLYQEDPLLTNISPGVHTIFVKEMNNCGVTSKTINIFGFRPYFSPNGDNKHDIWEVKGINFKSTAKIYIFDRYGKIVYKFFPANEQGWDGYFNGKLAPEGEYWFTAEMKNPHGKTIIRKGHFSLKTTNK